MTDYQTMTQDVFEETAKLFFEGIHGAMLIDNGTIAAIEAVNYALGAALQFMSDVYDLTDSEEIRQQCQSNGGSLASLLRKNCERALAAKMAEYELELLQSTMATIH
jgi:hypothetical protein